MPICLTLHMSHAYGWPEPYKYTVYDHYLVISLPKLPHIHVYTVYIFMVLANPAHAFLLTFL